MQVAKSTTCRPVLRRSYGNSSAERLMMFKVSSLDNQDILSSSLPIVFKRVALTPQFHKRETENEQHPPLSRSFAINRIGVIPYVFSGQIKFLSCPGSHERWYTTQTETWTIRRDWLYKIRAKMRMRMSAGLLSKKISIHSSNHVIERLLKIAILELEDKTSWMHATANTSAVGVWSRYKVRTEYWMSA